MNKKVTVFLTVILALSAALLTGGCKENEGSDTNFFFLPPPASSPPVNYSVSITQGMTNGSVTVNFSNAVSGKIIILTVSPNIGYRLKDGSLSVTRTGGSEAVAVAGHGTTWTFIMPAYDVTVNAEFEAVPAGTYTISIAAGIQNGTINADPASAAPGTTIYLTVTPNNGYRLKDGSLDVTETGGSGKVTVIGDGNNRQFTMPAYHVTVDAEFEAVPQGTYTVNIAADLQNGTISANPVNAASGTTITLTVSPDSGYRLKDGSLSVTRQSGGTVAVNGTDNTRTFTMPASNVNVDAEFEPVPAGIYSVHIPVIPYGTVSADPTEAAQGATVTLTISPNTGYKYKETSLSVTQTGGGGTVTVSGAGSTRTFTMPDYNVTVDAEFEAIFYDINILSNYISASPAPATMGTIVTITILQAQAQAAGFVFRDGSLSVLRSGGIVDVSGSGSTFTFTMPHYDVTVNAIFDKLYSVNVPAGLTGGSISANPASALPNTTVTLTISPDSGYRLKESNFNVTKTDGSGAISISGAGSTRTFNMPSSDVTVHAEFERVYSITVPTGLTGGSVSADKTVALAGESVTVIFHPANGYRLNSGSLNVMPVIQGNFNGDGTYTFTMPASDVTVSAQFEVIPPNTISIVFEGFEDENIDISQTNNVIIMNNSQSQITITVSGGYDQYYWHLNGSRMQRYVDNIGWQFWDGPSITLSGSDFSSIYGIGTHTITAIVVKNGAAYSKNVTFMVVW